MAKNATSHVYIIGAGIIGLTTSVSLAMEGYTVTVIDPDPASGATHHAGGMLAPAAEVVYRQDPLFPLMLVAAKWHKALFKHVGEYTQKPLGYRTEGTLVVAADKADAKHLDELVDYQAAHGMTVERVTVREVRRMEPALSPSIKGAVSLPGDTQVFPRMYAEALEDAAKNLGVQFIADTAISVNDDRIELEKSVIDLEGDDQVVLSNGLGARWTGGWFEGENPLHLRPVYGDILRVRPPKELDPIVTRVIRGFVEDRPVYVIPRVDGTMAIGATTRENDMPVPKVAGMYQLLRDAIRLVPAVEECEFLEATCGARPGTPDDLPYVGRVSPRLVISTGYFRHGILLSAFGARTVTEIIEGKPTSISIEACDPLRHQRQAQ